MPIAVGIFDTIVNTVAVRIRVVGVGLAGVHDAVGVRVFHDIRDAVVIGIAPYEDDIVFHFAVCSKAGDLVHFVAYGADPEAGAQCRVNRHALGHVKHQRQGSCGRYGIEFDFCGICEILVEVPVYISVDVRLGVGLYRDGERGGLPAVERRGFGHAVFIIGSVPVVPAALLAGIGVRLPVGVPVHRAAQEHGWALAHIVACAVLGNGYRITRGEVAQVEAL